MILYSKTARDSSRANHPENTDRRHRANFARQMVYAEFGRHARAIDYDDFVDRRPWQVRVARPQ